MARYDYSCTSCGTVFEVEHPMGEHPAVRCPACGAAAERVFTTSGIVFEGHGFYNTDQRGSGASTSGGEKGTGKQAGKKAGKKDAPAKESSTAAPDKG